MLPITFLCVAYHTMSQVIKAVVSAHNVNAPKHDTKDRPMGYVSSLTCTIDEGSFRVTWKRGNPPTIGSLVTIQYKYLDDKGIPKFATIHSVEPALTLEAAMEKCKIGLAQDRRHRVIPRTTWQTLPKDSRIFSIFALKSTSGLKMDAGDRVYLPASVKPERHDDSDLGLHAVTMPKDGSGKLYCTCPAWRFQKIAPSNRTCKHCDAVQAALQRSEKS